MLLNSARIGKKSVIRVGCTFTASSVFPSKPKAPFSNPARFDMFLLSPNCQSIDASSMKVAAVRPPIQDTVRKTGKCPMRPYLPTQRYPQLLSLHFDLDRIND